MNFFKPAIFILFAVIFTSFVFAQEDDELSDLFESEDIACEDLPSAFNKYRDDVQLNQLSLQKALSSTAKFLKETSKKGKVVEEELIEMIKTLEQVNDLSSDNSLALSDQAYNISYFLPDCVESNNSSLQ